MELPLQITYRNMQSSDAVTAYIREKAAKLDEFYPRITSCRVVVEAPHHHHKSGEPFRVRVNLGVPGNELVVCHESSSSAVVGQDEKVVLDKHIEIHPEHADVYVAVRDAFASARRQLQDYVKHLRGEVKSHVSPQPEGTW